MTRPSSLAERVYALALRAYPADFRAEFADEMRGFAFQALRHARRRGRVALARTAGHLAIDIVVTAPAARMDAYRDRLEARAAVRERRARLRATQQGEQMDTFFQDLRFAIRSLARRPAFTAVAGITLALGIGANAAIFSVVNAVLVRPLPLPNPERLMVIWGTQGSQHQQSVVYADYVEWRAQSRSFEDMGVFRGQSVNLTGRETPERLIGSFVSASFLRVVGAQAERGRLLLDRETEVETKEPVAVVTYGAWETRFGADSSLLGKTIVLNGQPLTVVGITKKGLQVPLGTPDVFIPIGYYPNAGGLQRGNRGVLAIGALKPSITMEAAQRELKTLAKRQEEIYPTTNASFGVELQAVREQLLGPVRGSIYIVLGAVVVVLLIACANVANLQLARGTARYRELSVRAALGAGRQRIAQLLLIESLLLAFVGGAAGVGLAVLGTKWLAVAVANSLPFNTTISVDGAVIVFALLVSVAAGVLFGVAPAWRASRTSMHDVLRARSGGSGVAQVATRNGLVVVQLALSLTLLTCAGLLTRTLFELQRVNTGFETKNVMTMQFRLPTTKYDSPDKIWGMFERAVAEIRTVPGVQSAALVRAFPLTGNGETMPVNIEGQAPRKPGDAPNMQINVVTPGYFSTMRIPQVAGRDIDANDRKDAVPVIVVNTEFAQKTWPGEPAIGKRIKFGGDDRWWTVVGVVGSTKHFALNETQLLQGYIPHAQRPQIFTTLAVRTTGDPLPLARSIREAIWRVDRDQPVWGVRTVEQLLDASVGSNKLLTMLTAGFAIIALVLAAVGIYGVLSYTMAQRTHEVGIRMALGAQARQVRRMVVMDGMRVVGVAVIIGLALSFIVTRWLRTQLFGVEPGDPLTLAAVTFLLTTVALLACYIPARRASRVDPLVALRTE